MIHLGLVRREIAEGAGIARAHHGVAAGEVGVVLQHLLRDRHLLRRARDRRPEHGDAEVLLDDSLGLPELVLELGVGEEVGVLRDGSSSASRSRCPPPAGGRSRPSSRPSRCRSRWCRRRCRCSRSRRSCRPPSTGRGSAAACRRCRGRWPGVDQVELHRLVEVVAGGEEGRLPAHLQLQGRLPGVARGPVQRVRQHVVVGEQAFGGEVHVPAARLGGEDGVVGLAADDLVGEDGGARDDGGEPLGADRGVVADRLPRGVAFHDRRGRHHARRRGRRPGWLPSRLPAGCRAASSCERRGRPTAPRRSRRWS